MTEPTNRVRAYVACADSREILVLELDERNGDLALTQKVPAGGSVMPLAASHDRRRLFAALRSQPYSVTSFAFDAASGRFSQLQNLSILPHDFAGQPWAADIHLTPDGRFLYASERRSSTLALFAVCSDGRIEHVANFGTESEPRGFAIDPSGRFLPAVGQASNSMTCYAIDATNGRLRELKKYAMGKKPNWVEIVTLP